MYKYLNIKIFLLIILTAFMGLKSTVFASKNRRKKTFKLGAPKNKLYDAQKKSLGSSEDSKKINIINKRTRSNSELISSQTATILIGQKHTDKALGALKNETKDVAKKVERAIKREGKRTSQQFSIIGVILLAILLYTYYTDFYLPAQKKRPLKIPKYAASPQEFSYPFFKKGGGCSNNGGGLKCWQRLIFLILFLLAAAMLWGKYLNSKKRRR